MHSKNASLFFRSKEHHHHHHLFRSAKKRTDPSSSWVNGETSRWVRAVRQPRRTRERRTTSVESAAVGFIQFIIRARSDDIFLSFSLCDKTQQASVTGKKTLLLERGFLLALKRRKGVVVFTVLGARTTEAKARSIRFGFGFDPKLSRVKGKRQRGVEGARKRERSVGTVSSVVVTRPRRGKVVSIPLRVIFVVLVECPFGISDLSLDLMNERERERSNSIARGARRRTKRDRGREDKGF
mgnify:CR=1 FL=1